MQKNGYSVCVCIVLSFFCLQKRLEIKKWSSNKNEERNCFSVLSKYLGGGKGVKTKFSFFFFEYASCYAFFFILVHKKKLKQILRLLCCFFFFNFKKKLGFVFYSPPAPAPAVAYSPPIFQFAVPYFASLPQVFFCYCKIKKKLHYFILVKKIIEYKKKTPITNK